MPLNVFNEKAKLEQDYFGVKTDKDIVPQSRQILQMCEWWGKVCVSYLMSVKY